MSRYIKVVLIEECFSKSVEATPTTLLLEQLCFEFCQVTLTKMELLANGVISPHLSKLLSIFWPKEREPMPNKLLSIFWQSPFKK